MDDNINIENIFLKGHALEWWTSSNIEEPKWMATLA